MSGNIGLIVLNLILVAMLILAWQLWRQSVPKRRKVKAVEVADWPSGPTEMHTTATSAHGVSAQDLGAPAVHADAGAPQLVTAAASDVPVEQAAANQFSAPVDYAQASVAVPGQADMRFAPPVAPAQVAPVPAAPTQAAPAYVAPVQPAAAAPLQPAQVPSPQVTAAAVNAMIDDDELAALLNSAPPTSTAPVGLFAQPADGAAPSGFSAPSSPAAPASLFNAPASTPVSSLAPPVAPAGAVSGSIGDDVSRQVGALLAAPRPAAQPVVSSLAAPAGASQTSVSTTDRLRLDITGRPVDDVMRSLVTRLGEMGYSVQTGPSGETVFQRGTTESIRIAVSAKEAASTDADGRPLPARADVEVVGGQLQETTEAVLFELIDHGFQLRWAVAGELVLSSFDGALARVNVNPTSSD